MPASWYLGETRDGRTSNVHKKLHNPPFADKLQLRYRLIIANVCHPTGRQVLLWNRRLGRPYPLRVPCNTRELSKHLYPSDLVISSVIFFASPNNIIVLSW